MGRKGGEKARRRGGKNKKASKEESEEEALARAVAENRGSAQRHFAWATSQAKGQGLMGIDWSRAGNRLGHAERGVNALRYADQSFVDVNRKKNLKDALAGKLAEEEAKRQRKQRKKGKEKGKESGKGKRK